MSALTATSPAAAYPAGEYLADIEKGIFAEMSAKTVATPDAFRRNLQRYYVRNLAAKVNPPAQTAPLTGFAAFFAEPNLAESDVRGACIVRLENIMATAKSAAAKAKDDILKAHLKDIISTIEKALDTSKN
jgi:hypothetical protein